LDASDGDLLLHTGVTGTAARMGHRLTIAMRSWQATVDWDGDEPCAVEVTVDLDSLDVVKGGGGVTPLTGPEKTLVRANALKCLRAQRFSRSRFVATNVDREGDSLRLAGKLDLNGHTADQIVGVRVEDTGENWRVTGRAQVRHSDLGIKQYSMLMGAMKVADEVAVTLAATLPRHLA
jgi:polyisoprenoid-binding protein YceI